MAVRASSAGQVDPHGVQGERQPVDSPIEQSIADGAHRVRATGQILVPQNENEFSVIHRHGMYRAMRCGPETGI